MTLSSASMTSLIDTLERRGLVERHRHPTDRRKVLIHLTGEARTIVDRTLPAVHATITAAVADLSEKDRERLITSLDDDSSSPGCAGRPAGPDGQTPAEAPAENNAASETRLSRGTWCGA